MDEHTASSVDKKRKRPPTFQHYPINRAKKLKRDWVEKTKIKSRWKAEKRKEGLDTRTKLDLPVYEESEGADNDGGQEDTLETPQEPSVSTKPPVKEHRVHPSRAHLHPNLSQSSKNERRSTKGERKSEDETETPKPSLADLTREAYSKSSLHTFKSDPLQKRRGAEKAVKWKEGGKVGRGQPNMKLRMNAMLEKIKRDLA